MRFRTFFFHLLLVLFISSCTLEMPSNYLQTMMQSLTGASTATLSLTDEAIDTLPVTSLGEGETTVDPTIDPTNEPTVPQTLTPDTSPVASPEPSTPSTATPTTPGTGTLPTSSFYQSSAGTTYYSSAQGLVGTSLKTALHNKIKNHTTRTYANLWSDFQKTDKKSNGKVWDMYSDVPGGTPPYEFTFGSDQCDSSGYSQEGDCYNREHSFPKSWWGGDEGVPMYTDLFHLVPTDGQVNYWRGNLAFGEVKNASIVSDNGSKVGSSNVPGYSKTVFEPIDAYKGDFARIYFYMATRYQNVYSSWSDDMFDGKTALFFEDWAINMLLSWHQADPVSTKELNRNDEIYKIQNNRNPFVDNPNFVSAVWG